MRHLNKVVFINSATVRYQEILIDGNIHFVGTQGVGKSTILRAILFFYNADTGKLGIPREKKTFAEYYFSFSNSFIIYEVVRETGPFCILAYKQSGRIAYRFIDAAYNPNNFITDNNALEGWDKVRGKLDEAGIDYTRKIERYEEFRNILYGNNEGKAEFKKYALLESKLFQNIPRTIQNVFLNAKLEADFIKKTMIDSLMEESMNIDLGIYRHHLQEFENEFKDIETYKNKKVQEKAEKIIAYHNHILKALSEKRENLIFLNQAVAQEEKKKPLLQKKIEKFTTDHAKEKEKLNVIETAHAGILEKINQEKGVWVDKSKTASEKKKSYEAKNITAIVERVNKEEELKGKKNSLTQEQATITTAFQDIEQKYKTLLDQLDNEHREFENIQGEKKINLKQTFAQFKDDAQNSFEKSEGQIRKQYKDKLEASEKNTQEKQQIVNELEKKQIHTQSIRFFEKELEAIKIGIRAEETRVATNDSLIKVKEAEKGKLLSKLEFDTGNIERTYEQNLEKLNAKLKHTETQLTKLNEWISSSSSALFGFLNEKYPGWENTIGKVCREDIIFNAELAPEFTQISNLLFGVKLDLGEIETTVKTLDGYNKERSDLEEEKNSIRKSIEQLEQKKLLDLEKLKKTLQPKIREFTDAIQQLSYAIELSKSKQVQLKLDQEDLDKKAVADKKKALEAISNQLTEAKSNYEIASLEKKNIAGELEGQIADKRIEKDTKINTQLALLNKELDEIEKLIVEFKIVIERRRKQVNESKHEELQGKGLDTKRLEIIVKELGEVTTELQFITQNQKLVLQYQIDKEEYLDKIDEFNSNIEFKDKQRKQEDESFSQKKQTLLQQIGKIKDELDAFAKELEETEKQLSNYEDFKTSKEFQTIEDEDHKGKENVLIHSISDYITRIREAHYSYIEELNSLTSAVNDFTGRFTANNIFSFKTGFVESTEYIDFAQTLKEFIDENKIAEFEKRVNKRYAEIINFIDKEITDLISKEGDIQQVISKINKDFQEKEKSFVSAISVIEMKIEDSANRIVDILKRIKAFNLEAQFNSFSSGPNLFSTDVDEKRIKEAINLLSILVKEIKESKSNNINIADSFELKFRVVENQNDSGWVEKLSNIGSEGTDILVKAMINIMLLNVFKESASRKFKNFKLHCMMDEIGRLHPGNVRGILKFANDRNILLINGSPIEHDALAYKHIYELRKDEDKNTRVKRLISVKNETPLTRS